MLGKLIKYDFKAIAKKMLPAYIAIIVFSLIVRLTLSFDWSSINASETITEILGVQSGWTVILYIFALSAVSILTFIFLFMHYHKSMFGDIGYLTHTLPAKTSTIINAKLINFAIWNLLSTAVIAASLITAFISSESIDVIRDIINAIMLSATQQMEGMAALVVLLYIAQAIFSLLLVTFCITVGQLFKKGKIGFSILFYFVISEIVGTIQAIASTIFMSISIGQSEVFIMEQIIIMLLAEIIIYVLISVGFYIGTHYLTKTRLNLE